MSRLVRSVRKTLQCLRRIDSNNLQWRNSFSSAHRNTKSPFDANILRILRNEIEYQSEYAPPRQPPTKFNSFVVEDRPGGQWMTMRRKFNNDYEEIKLEVTMFDGYETVSSTEETENVRFHISLLVDISKDGNNGDSMEFVCSAWPDCLEIQKVYILKRDNLISRPYMGPNFRNLNGELQRRFRDYLEERGVNDELSVFLHEYMMNKDRIELIQWFGKVKNFVES